MVNYGLDCIWIHQRKGEKTIEQVAEGYLSDLVNRSLLQVVVKNEFELGKCFRMHDVIRHLAIDKAEKECFGKVYEGHVVNILVAPVL